MPGARPGIDAAGPAGCAAAPGGGAPRWAVDTYAFAPGDVLLLYTDGATEARDADGTFYPLAERLAAFDGTRAPDDLLEELREDLLAHADGTLGDDAALVALLRTVP